MIPSFYHLLSIRYLLQRWDRAALIVVSIGLGVATLVSTRILNQCLETAASQTTTPLAASADLFVTNGELGVARTIAEEIRQANVAGVEEVRPLVFERVTLPDFDNRPSVVIGSELSFQMISDTNPLGVRFVETVERNWRFARLALSRRLIVLSKPLYDEWKEAHDDPEYPFTIRYGSRQIECLPIGYFEFEADSPVADLGRTLIGMEIGQAARFARPAPPFAVSALVGTSAVETVWDSFAPVRVNRIDISVTPGFDLKEVQSRIEAIVNGRAEVRTPELQGQSTKEIISGIQIGFALCSVGAMIVGLFLVYNALSVTVAERRHDIGVLRSIGATRIQVIVLFGTAAGILGVIGSLLGLPLGIALAKIVLREFEVELASMFLNPEVDPGWPTATTLIFASLAGITTSIVAALIPATQAAYEDPADAVRRIPGVAGGVWQMAHRFTCAGLIAGGVAMIITRHELPPRVGAFGGMMAALVGLLLAAPIIVGVFIRLAHPILRRMLPIEARLAADNLIRSPGRTGIVIGALGAGVAVMIQTAGVGRSNEEPVMTWLNEVIQADTFVFGGNLTEATSSQNPLDQEVGKALSNIEGVSGVAGLRYVRPEYNGTIVFLIAIDAKDFAEQSAPRRTEGLENLEQLRTLPEGNRVVISDNFARKHGVNAGDRIRLAGPRGPVDLEVVSTTQDYSWSRGTIFIDRQVYARLFGDNLIDIYHVFIEPSAGESSAFDRVSRLAAEYGLMSMDQPTMRKFLGDLIDRVYTLAYLQQIVVGVVASLGVITALLISVLQRKRELGLLLAIGATPAQVIRSVLAEAMLMGFFGTILGLLIGLPLEWYILKVILVEESGFIFDLLFPWRQALAISVGAITMAMLAGLLPAIHAVRTRIPEAVAYE